MDAMEMLLSRRSCAKLTEPAPDAETLDRLLTAALRAPDHALLRPSRFFLVRGEARERLGEVWAEALAARDPEATEEQQERVKRKALRAPLILVVAAVTREHPKVPEIEQVLTAGAAAQTILLGLHAAGFAGMWRTGGNAYDPRIKAAFGLEGKDHIVGYLYIGSPATEPPEMSRPTPPTFVAEWEGPRA